MQKRKKGEQVSKVIVFDMFGDENIKAFYKELFAVSVGAIWLPS